jgi:predicted tellurium resistance membrane protein TerC
MTCSTIGLMDLAPLFTVENGLALLTLAVLEIVLGIDNIVFIAILAGRLRPEQRKKARRLGLLAAMVMRILLLLAISWVMGLTTTLFHVPFLGEGEAGAITGKDIILLVGGLFLIAKATHEIHAKLEAEGHDERGRTQAARLDAVIVQIMVMDIVFSLDSVITAVGMVKAKADQPTWVPPTIMIAAVVISIVVMLAFARPINDFVERHPTIKMLALSFLLLIGVMLIADGFDKHIPKGYVYFAMAFSLFVELLNMRLRRVSAHPVHLKDSHLPETFAD